MGENYGDAHSIIYVRVAPEDKARFRKLADRDFQGSMAACFRYLLEAYAGGKTRECDLDEE